MTYFGLDSIDSYLCIVVLGVINSVRYYCSMIKSFRDRGYRECIRQEAGKAIFAGDSEACSAKVESD